jgi:undecaprenyl-diphosphatase
VPDKPLGRWVIEHRIDWLNWLFEGLSRIGTLGAVWIAIAIALTLLWRRPAIFLTVAAGVYSADLIATLLKTLIPRHRPRVHQLVPGPKDHSFPSGHAATSFAGATLLAWYAPRLRMPLYVLAAAIAFSRVYVGVHWPLDILAGAVLGWAVATALRQLVTRRLRSRPAPPPAR